MNTRPVIPPSDGDLPPGSVPTDEESAGSLLDPVVEPYVPPASLEGWARKKKRKKRKKGGDRSRGRSVETFFRTSYRMHVDMSSLADTKANIMISINGIIVSVLLAGSAGFGRVAGSLLLPGGVILFSSLVSMVFAVLAARPRIGRDPVTLEEVRSDRKGILFFGTFISLSSDDFVKVMEEILDDAPRLHAAMLRDIHGLGGVLDRKFRLLRTSYTVFMWGISTGGFLFLLQLTGLL